MAIYWIKGWAIIVVHYGGNIAPQEPSDNV